MKRILTILLLFILISHNIYSQTGYQRSNQKDIPILTASALILGSGFYLGQKVQPLTQNEVNDLNPVNINRFDRWACSRWSPQAAHWSDILLVTSLLSPGLLLTSDEIQNDRETFGMMYFESMILTYGLTQLTKSLAQRIRPGAYHPDASDEFKYHNRNVRASFFSGHTSMAFASLVFLASVYDRYHSDSEWTPYIWGSAVGIASTVGFLRILAGKHFPTDVIVGAVVGGAVGYFIPKIYESDSKNSDLNQNREFKVSISVPL